MLGVGCWVSGVRCWVLVVPSSHFSRFRTRPPSPPSWTYRRVLKYTRWYTTLGRFLEEPSSLLLKPHHTGNLAVNQPYVYLMCATDAVSYISCVKSIRPEPQPPTVCTQPSRAKTFLKTSSACRATQGPSYGYLKGQFSRDRVNFWRSMPQNGSKNDPMAPITNLECPHEGHSVAYEPGTEHGFLGCRICRARLPIKDCLHFKKSLIVLKNQLLARMTNRSNREGWNAAAALALTHHLGALT